MLMSKKGSNSWETSILWIVGGIQISVNFLEDNVIVSYTILKCVPFNPTNTFLGIYPTIVLVYMHKSIYTECS